MNQLLSYACSNINFSLFLFNEYSRSTILYVSIIYMLKKEIKTIIVETLICHHHDQKQKQKLAVGETHY